MGKAPEKNWVELIEQYETLIGREYRDCDTKEIYTFIGLIHGEADFYYGLIDENEKLMMCSCVGDIEGFKMKLIE